jgi:hypothetical protein
VTKTHGAIKVQAIDFMPKEDEAAEESCCKVEISIIHDQKNDSAATNDNSVLFRDNPRIG